MRSTFYGLEIAKTGLFTAQTQLDITGHNMSNASTVGYTRQRVVTQALPPGVGSTFVANDMRTTAGRGVESMYIEQVRNPFLDYQYRKENALATECNVKSQYFGYVEALFNNELDDISVTSGMTKLFDGFYNSLHALTESPSDEQIRANVMQNAITLTDTMKYYYDRLVEQQDTLNESVKITVNEINDITEQIGILNKQIASFEINGARANDLRDQRNDLLDALSGIIPINAYEDGSGQLVVEAGGRSLVRHTAVSKLAVNQNVENPIDGEQKLYGVYWADSEGKATVAEFMVEGGALQGYMTIRDGDMESNMGIPYVIDMLNDVCKTLVEQINAVHSEGYTLPIDGNDTRTGVNFFDPNGLTAKTISVSSDVLENVNNIAASDMPVAVDGEENDQRGNNKVALQLVALINNTDDDGNPYNLNSQFKEMLSAVSQEQKSINTKASSQTLMLAHVETQRRSISDVSMDEEMTNMIKFSHSYNAAARMITTMDEGLDTVINKLGLVGR